MSRLKRGVVALLVLTLVVGGVYLIGSSGETPPEKQVAEQKGETPVANDQGAKTAQVNAQDFSLTDINGKEVRLSELHGQKVLINFWTTWCTYCREEMPLLQKFYEQTKGKNWQVLTVNITSTERSLNDVQEYLKENNYTFPVLLDIDGEVAAQYGINSIPTSFILNEKGEVTEVKIGPFNESELMALLK